MFCFVLFAGTNNLDVASSLCNPGILKRSIQKYDEALVIFEESLTIRMKILSDTEHPDVVVCKKHISFLKQLNISVRIVILFQFLIFNFFFLRSHPILNTYDVCVFF